MRRKKLVIIIIVAIIAMYMADKMGSTKKPKKEPEKKAEVAKPMPPPEILGRVVVAKANIPPRVLITAEMVEIASIEKDEIDENAIKSLAGVIGKATKEPHIKGEQIIKDRLHDYSGKRGLALSIPDNLRAITVKIDDISGVGGFVQQGDFVDIIAFYTDKILDEPYAVTIAQNVQVLSVGKQIRLIDESVDMAEEEGDDKGQTAGKAGATGTKSAPKPASAGAKPSPQPAAAGAKPSAAKTTVKKGVQALEIDDNTVEAAVATIITVATQLEVAEKLTVAESLGKLRLVLRSPFNQEITNTQGILSKDVTKHRKVRDMINAEREKNELKQVIIDGSPVDIYHRGKRIGGR